MQMPVSLGVVSLNFRVTVQSLLFSPRSPDRGGVSAQCLCPPTDASIHDCLCPRLDVRCDLRCSVHVHLIEVALAPNACVPRRMHPFMIACVPGWMQLGF